jgi:hypothetical protein
VRELIYDTLRRRLQPASQSSGLQVQPEPFRSRAQMGSPSINSPCAFRRSSTTLSQLFVPITLHSEWPLATPSYPASLFRLPVSDLPSASPHADLHRTRVTDTPIYIQIDPPHSTCRSSTASPSLALPLPLPHQTFLAHPATQRMPSQLVAPPLHFSQSFPAANIVRARAARADSHAFGHIELFTVRAPTRSNFPIAHLHT